MTVSVTPTGEETLAHAPSLLQDQFRDELARLEEWEQHLMLSNLQRIAAIMGAESLDAAPHLVSDGVSLATTFADKKPR